MKKKSQKGMTIEDLARITQNSFGGLEVRINKRFDGLENRIENLELG